MAQLAPVSAAVGAEHHILRRFPIQHGGGPVLISVEKSGIGMRRDFLPREGTQRTAEPIGSMPSCSEAGEPDPLTTPTHGAQSIQ
jgi:hypothetical protein